MVDREAPATSTKVAAGIVNPITGPNLTLSWRFAQLWPVALAFYRRVEAETGTSLFREMPLQRLLASDKQVAKWEQRLGDPSYQELVDTSPVVPPVFNDDRGGFECAMAGYLDTRAFVAASKAAFAEEWRNGEVSEGECEGEVVFCEGASAMANALFDWVPFKLAKGEILTIRATLPEDRIVNGGGVWVLPIGDGLFRAGATYDWDRSDCEPTAEGRAEIEARLGRLLRVPFEVVDHQAGVRPVVRASKLLMGRHPAHENVGFFNGLGSKGVLTAPFFAGQLADHFCGEGEIDPEVDLRKNLE